ncbi:hypothetical protein CYLTODRAFT_348426 [Cylindrobasidium torrendii FP15055 ss-10]|uniref:GPI-anchor transamidase n=1 Tax=Cylindrobasidium torrendii FP15055 ss-10 TaxID=1314674 RepID=A0A0D7BIT7_9AGAR|nr:hypothetical protein CYLTODRAFT_348426 [Cylindrobasidium torrendii FP15055 ss-10]
MRAIIFSICACLALASPEESAQEFFAGSSNHTNNWAVLISASKYWFNYRHMSNTLALYRTVKRLGIPDSNIIMMLADDAACNPRNRDAANVYPSPGGVDLYGDNIEVDYRGYEVTVENVIRLLTGRQDPSVPRSKRLLTDDRSNIFVYMTGHGGNEFLKFQDSEEISAHDVGDAFAQMWEKKRYHEIFFMIDTCQASSMYSQLHSPNIFATGSSQVGENSYSYHNDHTIGVSLIDRYTHYILGFLENVNKTSHATMQDFFDYYDTTAIGSHPGVRSDLFARPLNETLITDFFGGVAHVEVSNSDCTPVFGDVVEEEAPVRSKETMVVKAAPPSSPQPTTVDGKGIRAWGSFGLIGLILSWVAFRTSGS